MRNPLIHHQKSARPLSPLLRLQGDVLGLRTVLLEVAAANAAVRGLVLHRDDQGVHAAVVIKHGLMILRREVLDGRRRRKAVGRAALGRHRGIEVQLGKVQGLLGNDLDVGEWMRQVLVGRGRGVGRQWQWRRGEAGLQVRRRSHWNHGKGRMQIRSRVGGRG